MSPFNYCTVLSKYVVVVVVAYTIVCKRSAVSIAHTSFNGRVQGIL